MSYPEKAEHKRLMISLQEKQGLIADIIGNKEVSYIDVPLYRNVGDLLIMQGTLAFFRRYKIHVRYKANWFNVSRSQIKESDVVVFQGGGNLGDLYGGCQVIREQLIPLLKNQRVIILPQTIFFESSQNYQRCCKIFREHKDLHIFVRDNNSFELAKKMTDHVYLMPDMAHQLYPMQRRSEPANKCLALMRVDKETLVERELPKLDKRTDWNLMFDKTSKLMVFFMRLLRVGAILRLNRLPGSLGTDIGILMANALVWRANKLFSQFETVVTDRLHGHILCCLLDIPHTVFDNSYGKNSHYVELWTGTSDLVAFEYSEHTS